MKSPARSKRRAAHRAALEQLNIRRAQSADLVSLEFFFDSVLRKDYFLRRGQLKDMLAGKNHDVYLAEVDAVLVGVAVLTRGSRLVNALVHPAYRGLGIGRALVTQSGAREVRAKLDMSTGDPTDFYRSLGFQPTGERNHKGNIALLRREPPEKKPQPRKQRRNT